MSRFSPVTAATEGFRVMRREPKAVAAWTLLWAGALVVVALLKPRRMGADVLFRAQSDWTWAQIVQNFGSFTILFVAIFLLIWVVTTTAVFRSVLRPEERAGFFLRLGLDEFRNGLFSAVAFLVVPVVGGALAGGLFLLFTPFLHNQSEHSRYLIVAGSVMTGCLGVWLGTRLSLIAVETFAERRFHMSAYWPLARGRFWRVLAAYAVIAVMMGVLAPLLGAVSLAIFALVGPVNAIGVVVLKRAILYLMVGGAAVSLGGIFMLPSILIGACQAYMFRALADDSPTVYGMSWAPDPKVHPPA